MLTCGGGVRDRWGQSLSRHLPRIIRITTRLHVSSLNLIRYLYLIKFIFFPPCILYPGNLRCGWLNWNVLRFGLKLVGSSGTEKIKIQDLVWNRSGIWVFGYLWPRYWGQEIVRVTLMVEFDWDCWKWLGPVTFLGTGSLSFLEILQHCSHEGTNEFSIKIWSSLYIYHFYASLSIMSTTWFLFVQGVFFFHWDPIKVSCVFFSVSKICLRIELGSP